MFDKVKRDPLFDVVKFIAIFMVIYSHVVFYRPGFNLVTMPSHAMNFIIMINMPLFFMVSGCLSRRLHGSGDWLKLANRLLRYFWPLLVVSCVIAFFECLVEHSYSFSAVPIWCLKKFIFCHWFFFALAACDVLTFLIWRYGDKSGAKVSLGFMFFCACLVSSGRVLYAAKITAMIPFYWFGLVLLPKILFHRRLLMPIGCLGLSVIILAAYLFDNVATNGYGFYWDWLDIWHPSVDKAIRAIGRYVIGGLGSLSIVCVLKLVIEKIPSAAGLSIFGTETLGVYLFQGIMIKRLSNRIVSLEAGSSVILIASLVVFAMSFAFVRVLRANKWVRQLVFGINLF